MPAPLHPSLMSSAELASAWLTDGDPPLPECAYDPELHTGPDGAESAEQQAARQDVAREICATCPALLWCDLYTLRVRPTTGVWAGRTPAELTTSVTFAAVFAA